MKAVIPAAGLGTRFLPATKAQPKEMLPVFNKPTIQYVVEEAVNSGIDDIIIITGKGKRPIEDHFDKSWELEYNLEKKVKFLGMLPKEDVMNQMYNSDIYIQPRIDCTFGAKMGVLDAGSFKKEKTIDIENQSAIMNADKILKETEMSRFVNFFFTYFYFYFIKQFNKVSLSCN